MINKTARYANKMELSPIWYLQENITTEITIKTIVQIKTVQPRTQITIVA
jgi:hypothetical protein